MKLHFSPRLLGMTLLGLVAVGALESWAQVGAMAGGARKFAVVTLGNPRSLAVDGAGNLYVGDAEGGKVHKITAGGEVTAIGGAGAASIGDPLGLGVGKDGTVYVADASGSAVYRIPAGGAAVALVGAEGAASLKTPTGVAADKAGNVFVANNGEGTILKITPKGEVSVFAGKAGVNGAADGTGAAASFVTPRGIAIDGADNLYVADEGNSNIRKITPAGVVTTLAGGAGESGSADGVGAAARFGAPRSLAATADGTVYVADTDNHLIRKVTTKGEVTTLAGKAGEDGSADGTGAAARFKEPRGIAVDAAGNVYVADTGNASVRQITPAGVVTTIAGAAPGAAKP